MRSLKHLNKYLFRYRTRFGLGVLFVVIGTFFSVFSVPYIGKSMDLVLKMLREGKGANAEDSGQLMMFGILILGFTVINGIFMFLKRQTIIVMSRLIENDLKNDVYAHYQQLDTAFYKRNSTGDLMNRISEDVSRVRMYLGPAIMYVIDTVAMFLLTIVFMLRVDMKLTLFALIPLPLLAVVIYFVSDKINRRSTRVQEKLSDLSTLSQETFSGIRILKAYGRERNTVEKQEEESSRYQESQLKLALTESLFQPFVMVMIGMSTIISLYIGGMQVMDPLHKVTVGNITEFIVYVSRLSWPIASLGWVVSLVQRAAASQTRINEFLNTRPSVTNPDDGPLLLEGEIEFRNVSFTYSDSGIQALKDISFKVKPGQTLAIIGRTGSGKSTIASLLTRLYDVSSGEILLDGKNIRSINLHALRAQTGYVPQEVFLFSESIADNIAFSYAPAELLRPTREAIEQAARDAAIYSSVMEFPEKFDTVVGERGITLSGGQKQRISIARAIIGSPRIIVFDDCLSAVDTRTEEEILSNLRRIMKNKTALIISHRVSSVKHAGHIIVMDEGRIIEKGSHDELLEKKGVYSDLYHKQLLENIK